MNEARLSAEVINRDAAAALMAPLTDLVLRPGPPFLPSIVSDEDRRQNRRIAGDGGGSGRRPHHCRRSGALVPGLPALSRNAFSWQNRLMTQLLLIDPLDGTKEFVAGRDEFTVNLALVSNGTPLLGIIGVPALGLIWRGWSAEARSG